MFMLYIDLAELPHLFDGVPFWSARRPALGLVQTKRLPGRQHAAARCCRARFGRVADRQAAGRAHPAAHAPALFRLLHESRELLLLLQRSRRRPAGIVAEITNTPWRERHQYVLEIDAGGVPSAGARLQRFEFDKTFHVSPFMPMDLQYRWHFSRPGQRLFVHMQNLEGAAHGRSAQRLSLRGGTGQPRGPAGARCAASR